MLHRMTGSALRMTLAVLVTLAAVACGPKDGIKVIRASEDTEADFGKIMEIDGPVTVRLLCRNEFADTLFPMRIHTPCGCTIADTDKKPIAPGEDEVIEVTYNPAYRPGIMMEEIQVYYQNSPVRMRSFIIKGNVIGYNHPIEEDRPYNMGEGLYMSHRVLVFGSMRPGQTRDIFFRHGNGNTKKANIVFDIPQEYQPYVRMRQPGKMKADERDTIHVKFTMPEGADTVLFKIQPMVNGKPTESAITVKADLMQDN